MRDVALVVRPTERKMVLRPTTRTLLLSPKGRRGAPGADGDKFFQFTQSSPSAEWVIAHTLNKFPSVTVVDSAGSIVIGAVKYDSNAQVTVTFGGGFSGKAYLN